MFIAAAASNITTDQQALLALKAHISYDHTNLFARNWTSSTSVCSWIGITCDVNSHRVIGLNISSFNLQGTIPPQLGNLSSLQTLDLSHNKLSGNIPSSIFNMHTLKLLYFSDNQLFGSLSFFIFNVSSVTTIDLSINGLSGEMPREIGNLPYLARLAFATNNLVGVAPVTIFNMSALKEISLLNNSLSGSLPSRIDLSLPNVETLNLGINSFSGTIPSSITNASKLSDLELGVNLFSGFIPNTFVNMADNYLTSSTPELSFLSSLENCKKLKVLILTGNPLDGILPKSIGNLSLSLETILMANCSISGNIPQVVGNLGNLLVLELGGNNLTGPIPITFSQLQTLQALGLTRNKLAGPITDELCHLARLHSLVLQGLNRFTSALPSTIWNLKDILFIDVSSNSLNVLIGLNFSRNNLSGDIPITIGGLKNLQQMFLEYNRLEGSIPESFGDLSSLEVLDLSKNKISGAIPASLQKLLYLKHLNLSFNKLEGEIPRGGPFANLTAKSFMGNELLKMLLLVIILPLSTALIVVVTLTLKWKLIECWKSRTGPSNDGINSPQAIRRFSYHELLRATDRFSENNLIGIGSFGSIYVARLQDGMEVAVKVFHQQYERALKSFEDECEVMKRIRHRNLVKIISSCSNDDFKALIMKYMPNGSLENCLYSGTCMLDIFQSNVLLDEDMVAHISDFGIAKLLSGEDQLSIQIQTLATIGYMAPEYGTKGRVCTRGDVYSYGIMLMEMFTKKKLTDEIFIGELSLNRWINDLLPVSVMEVIDTNLLRGEERFFAAKEQILLSVLNLATECTIESRDGNGADMEDQRKRNSKWTVEN
ncbi:protein kinase domain-containing protein [Citrus sinensis]|nr:protein kinase domain-containing protein [Citrus sinensis]